MTAPTTSRPALNNYSGSQRPVTGLLAYSPDSWIPYIQLARLSPPAGLCLIYLPYLFGVLYAAIRLSTPPLEPGKASAILLAACFFYSNAGH
ncbi:hypothetical protein V1506DRAFT_547579 [Lipomyces tetrasporus]